MKQATNRLLFDPEDRGYMFLWNFGCFSGLRGVISQKIELFIATAVRTSDVTFALKVLKSTKMVETCPRLGDSDVREEGKVRASLT
jgi:hypothetical protein